MLRNLLDIPRTAAKFWRDTFLPPVEAEHTWGPWQPAWRIESTPEASRYVAVRDCLHCGEIQQRELHS